MRDSLHPRSAHVYQRREWFWQRDCRIWYCRYNSSECAVPFFADVREEISAPAFLPDIFRRFRAFEDFAVNTCLRIMMGILYRLHRYTKAIQPAQAVATRRKG